MPYVCWRVLTDKEFIDENGADIMDKRTSDWNDGLKNSRERMIANAIKNMASGQFRSMDHAKEFFGQFGEAQTDSGKKFDLVANLHENELRFSSKKQLDSFLDTMEDAEEFERRIDQKGNPNFKKFGKDMSARYIGGSDLPRTPSAVPKHFLKQSNAGIRIHTADTDPMDLSWETGVEPFYPLDDVRQKVSEVINDYTRAWNWSVVLDRRIPLFESEIEEKLTHDLLAPWEKTLVVVTPTVLILGIFKPDEDKQPALDACGRRQKEVVEEIESFDKNQVIPIANQSGRTGERTDGAGHKPPEDNGDQNNGQNGGPGEGEEQEEEEQDQEEETEEEIDFT